MNIFTRRFARIVLACTFAGTSACSSSSSNPATAPVATQDASPSVEGGSVEGGPSAGDLDVMTDKGMVHGAVSNGVRSFLGIPFGASTGGANRWKAPQPPAAWTGTKMATKLGPICPQINPSTMA